MVTVALGWSWWICTNNLQKMEKCALTIPSAQKDCLDWYNEFP